MRKADFKLGIIHGKLRASKESEAAIQRNVFLCQSIKVRRSNDEAKNSLIRLFGYEMPLGKHRDLCIDLVGYDSNFNLYLIELKKGSSNQSLPEAIAQINRYTEIVSQIKQYIEVDFKKTFYLPIKFKSIKKIILAPREFYKGKTSKNIDSSIEYLYFGVKDIIGKKLGSTVVVHKVFQNLL